MWLLQQRKSVSESSSSLSAIGHLSSAKLLRAENRTSRRSCLWLLFLQSGIKAELPSHPPRPAWNGGGNIRGVDSAAFGEGRHEGRPLFVVEAGRKFSFVHAGALLHPPPFTHTNLEGSAGNESNNTESRASRASRFRGSLPLPTLAAPSARPLRPPSPTVSLGAAAPPRRAGKPLRTAGPSWEAPRGNSGCGWEGASGGRGSLPGHASGDGRRGAATRNHGAGQIGVDNPESGHPPPPQRGQEGDGGPGAHLTHRGGRGTPLTATSGCACVLPVPSHAWTGNAPARKGALGQTRTRHSAPCRSFLGSGARGGEEELLTAPRGSPGSEGPRLPHRVGRLSGRRLAPRQGGEFFRRFAGQGLSADSCLLRPRGSSLGGLPDWGVPAPSELTRSTCPARPQQPSARRSTAWPPVLFLGWDRAPSAPPSLPPSRGGAKVGSGVPAGLWSIPGTARLSCQPAQARLSGMRSGFGMRAAAGVVSVALVLATACLRGALMQSEPRRPFFERLRRLEAQVSRSAPSFPSLSGVGACAGRGGGPFPVQTGVHGEAPEFIPLLAPEMQTGRAASPPSPPPGEDCTAALPVLLFR